MNIKVGDLSNPEIRALVETHRAEMGTNDNARLSNTLNLDGLKSKDVTFFAVREGETLTGCGAIKELNETHGEIKSMHTVRRFRRRGVSAALLFHMIKLAEERGYTRLSLETNPGSDYKPARKLYERLGFEICGAFGDYEDHKDSIFMTKSI